MSETVTENAEVARYLAAVHDELIDLEPADRDDLLEDLEAHLYEVLAESGGASLESCLGAPEQYAAELRASAGFERRPVAIPPVLVRWQRRVAASTLWPSVQRVAQQRWAVAAREFLPTLRPGWWVVRGWLALFVLVVWLHGNDLAPYTDRIVVPTYRGNWVTGLLAVLVAVSASVALGLRTPSLPEWVRRGVLLVDLAIVGYVMIMYGPMQAVAQGFGTPSRPTYVMAAPTAAAAPYHGTTVDGRHPLNIYPYDAQGRLLSGVRLLDDRGRPIEGLGRTTGDGRVVVRVLPSDAAGAVVSNEFPQRAGTTDLNALGLDPNGNPNLPPTAGPSAEAAYGRATPMPTPTVFVPPMAGATPAPTPSAAPTQSLNSPKPRGTATSAAASKPTTRATVPARSGAGRSASPTP